MKMAGNGTTIILVAIPNKFGAEPLQRFLKSGGGCWMDNSDFRNGKAPPEKQIQCKCDDFRLSPKCCQKCMRVFRCKMLLSYITFICVLYTILNLGILINVID